MGILFSRFNKLNDTLCDVCVFVPMYGDSFFTRHCLRANTVHKGPFSSPCMGILFSRLAVAVMINRVAVFVPMYGDSFFTYQRAFIQCPLVYQFSSPCMGILFSQPLDDKAREWAFGFSSPCMGILFSHREFMDNPENSRFRPHVWGFFFHFKRRNSL